MQPNRWIAGLLCLFMSTGALADPAVLTWQECLKLAAQKNPDLRSAIDAMQASRAQYFGSYNGILPQLSLSNSYTDSNTVEGLNHLWQAQGTANLDLIDFNQWANIRSASAAWRQNQANAQVASSNVLLSLYR